NNSNNNKTKKNKNKNKKQPLQLYTQPLHTIAPLNTHNNISIIDIAYNIIYNTYIHASDQSDIDIHKLDIIEDTHRKNVQEKTARMHPVACTYSCVSTSRRTQDTLVYSCVLYM